LRLAPFRRRRDLPYAVGPFVISLPAGHALPAYRSRWRLYDEPLRLVAEGLRTLRDEISAIDVGANVGDSAALMNAGGRLPVLCIEGDPVYVSYLKRNAAAIGPHIAVEECFVDSREGFANPTQLVRGRGTTSAIRALDVPTAAGVPVRRLEQIIARHPSFDHADLIKLDTDGRDFEILLSHGRYLEQRKPVLFFEYALQFSNIAPDLSIQCVQMLLHIGYLRMIVFDNFGNRLLSTGSLETFKDLNLYLLCNARYGTAVYYFDVCAISERDRELDALLLSKTDYLASRAPKQQYDPGLGTSSKR
jgi:FkbM family methyltransferase